MSAGQDTIPHKAPAALAELPPASLNALTILLETWHRIAENSASNGMDAMALAVALTPCLAWNPPAGKEARKVDLPALQSLHKVDAIIPSFDKKLVSGAFWVTKLAFIGRSAS